MTLSRKPSAASRETGNVTRSRLVTLLLMDKCLTIDFDGGSASLYDLEIFKTSIKSRNLMIRLCEKNEFDVILRIINDAAVAYRDVIPGDRWHEPYMSAEELAFEIADGVVFWCVDDGAGPVAVMGIQDRGDVALVRHAYTLTAIQKSGHGSRLLRHVESVSPRRELLVGTWKAAEWAVRFYEKNWYLMVSEDKKNILLRKYWKIPDRQVDTSVVLRKMIPSDITAPVP